MITFLSYIVNIQSSLFSLGGTAVVVVGSVRLEHCPAVMRMSSMPMSLLMPLMKEPKNK